MRRELKIKDILVYLLSGVVLMFEFYFGVISGLLFVTQVVVISLILTLLLRVLPSNKTIPFGSSVKKSFFGILATLGFFLSIFLSFTTYYNLFPGKLSDITISNGKQKIVFMQMSHIATHAFYESKKETIEKSQKLSPIFLVEGVRPGTEESQKKFNQALGVEFDHDLYPALAGMAQLEVQSGGFLLHGVSSGVIENVDMSLDEIVSYISTGATMSGSQTSEVDIASEISFIESLPQEERSFIAFVSRAFLNWSIINMMDLEKLSLGDKAEIFDIILTKRNAKITDFVLKNPDKNIVVMYGALHFAGVFESLKKYDKSWKIESYVSSTPYSD